MPNAPQTTEIPGQNPDPVKLLKDLENPAMDTDQKKFNYLRGFFLEEADVDEYIQYLDTDEEIDLTKKQLKTLKGALQSFKVYLKEIYLPETGERIKRFYERLEQGTKAFANPEATPQELEVIGKTRRRVAQAMQIAKKPRGVKGKSLRRGTKGKSLREVTQKEATSASESKKELTPEQIEDWLGEFKTRFDALPQLHKGIKFAEVEKSLKADPESMAKLQALDAKGHAMNVFGEESGEFIFASAWDNYEKVSLDHRNIAYDLEGQKLAEKNGYKPNGNAVDIAKAMGVVLADPNLHEQLRKAIAVNGGAWLKTDAATRKNGYALDGNSTGIYVSYALNHPDNGSFRAALRVKKA